MISKNLYSEALIKPLQQGANKLYIVSGYASATMASRHIKDILDYSTDFKISLIIGMCPIDGLDTSTHNGFVNLMENSAGIDFECKYVCENPAVHSKIYVWCKDDTPFMAFAGSANYTQPAFGSNRKEVLTLCEPEVAYKYYEEIEPNTIYCNHGEVEEHIIIKAKRYSPIRRTEEINESEIAEQQIQSTSGIPKVTLSLLARDGEVGARSGLNWGQRPRREPNQAYIPLPTNIARSGFFPLNKTHFTVLTDDNKNIILRVEQQNYKAITTPLNNSLIGEYFRNRLGLANGQYVTRQDLERYGRTDVDFYKIDEETFYMDFSVNID
jgi:hypothetical protein